MRVPPTGSYEHGRAHKAGRFGSEDKENVPDAPASSAERRAAEETLDFGMAFWATKKRKTVPATTYGNIHALPHGASKKKMPPRRFEAKGTASPVDLLQTWRC